MISGDYVEVGDARLEYKRIPATKEGLPPVVLLHEGLGSVSMWRDFPERVAETTGAETIVYSRRGYGSSTPLKGKRDVDYMHIEAREVLPKVLERLGVDRPILLGHSDGGSIALIYAASGCPTSGLIVMAPHIFVEDLTVASIEVAKQVYETTDLGKRLGRYHADADHTFWGWNDIWLNPAFKAWNIEALVPQITAPILAIQGEDDEYGTRDQVDGIRRLAKAPCEVVLLPACKHSPHRDQTGATLELVARFVANHA